MYINMQPKAMMVSTDGSEDAKDAFYVENCFFFVGKKRFFNISASF